MPVLSPSQPGPFLPLNKQKKREHLGPNIRTKIKSKAFCLVLMLCLLQPLQFTFWLENMLEAFFEIKFHFVFILEKQVLGLESEIICSTAFRTFSRDELLSRNDLNFQLMSLVFVFICFFFTFFCTMLWFQKVLKNHHIF